MQRDSAYRYGLAISLVAFLSFSTSHVVLADGHSNDDDAFYLGVGGGVADVSLGNFDSTSVVNVYAGYKLTDVVFLELAVGQTGEFEVGGDADDAVEMQYLNFILRGQNEISSNLDAYIKFGASAWSLDATSDVNGVAVDISDESGASLMLGFGVAWYFVSQASLWLGADQYYEVDNITVTQTTLGLQVDF